MLMRLHRLHEQGRIRKAFMRAGIEPREALPQYLDIQQALLKV